MFSFCICHLAFHSETWRLHGLKGLLADLTLIRTNFFVGSTVVKKPVTVRIIYKTHSLTDLIFTSTKIIDKSKHWSLILFQESIAINRLKPSLNHGTKASKDLLIFN